MMEGDPQLGSVCPICGLSVRAEDEYRSVLWEVPPGALPFLDLVVPTTIQTRAHRACLFRVTPKTETLEYE